MAIGQQSYWTSARVGRRSVLRGVGVGAVGLTAAALIGCSSSGNAPMPTGPADTRGAAGSAAQPRRGGILKQATKDDIDTFDQLLGQSGKSTRVQHFAYSRLMKYDSGDGKAAPGSLSGDAAEKVEQVDAKTFIFHLRRNATYDKRPPTNGRAMVAEDVLKSWEKYSAKSNYRTALVHAAAADAPVDKVEAIDDHTVRFKLAFPDAIFLNGVAAERNLWIHPMESMNGGFDPNKDMRGTGPFYLAEYRPSISLTWKRNPDWYGGPSRPYLDGVEEPIITVDAQIEAQFKAGNLDWLGSNVTGLIPNLPLIVKDVKDTQMVTGSPPASGSSIDFSSLPGQPWADARLKRALSMCVDRNILIDVFFDPAALEKIGVKTNRYWNNPINAGFGDFWLNSQGPDFGPAAQYMKYNVAEATKLMGAAGYSPQKPLKFELIHTPNYAGTGERGVVIQSTAKPAGFDISLWSSDYTADWVPRILRGQTKWTASQPGLAAAAIHAFSDQGHPVLHLQAWFQSSGSMNVVGKPTQYPALDTMIQKARVTYDRKEMISIIHDVQRFIIDNMVVVPIGPAIDTVNIAHKRLHGPDRYQTWPGGLIGYQASEVLPDYWIGA